MPATPVREALDSAVIALTAAGVETPRLDAEVLLAHALGVDRARLVIDRDAPVEGSAIRIFQTAVRRRAVQREPVAYITGVRGFRHLDLHVDARVLVPRPETETLVEAALDLPRGARVVDVGTGSGAVALALKDERPDLHVTGTDVSEGALAVARANAQHLDLDVAFVRADLLIGAPEADAIVANPPYVQDGAALAPEITRHEPHVALFAGPDGLALVRTLIEQAAERRVAFLALEIGMGQAPAVALLMRAAGFARTQARPDLAGIDRVVAAWR